MIKQVDTPIRALCKFRGLLVIAEFSKSNGHGEGRCPECGNSEFYTRYGWVECGCGFAINESDYNKIIGK